MGRVCMSCTAYAPSVMSRDRGFAAQFSFRYGASAINWLQLYIPRSSSSSSIYRTIIRYVTRELLPARCCRSALVSVSPFRVLTTPSDGLLLCLLIDDKYL